MATSIKSGMCLQPPPLLSACSAQLSTMTLPGHDARGDSVYIPQAGVLFGCGCANSRVFNSYVFLMISLLISSCAFAEEAPQAETRQSGSYKTDFVPWEFSTLQCQESTGAKQVSRGNVWADDSSVAAICSHQMCVCAPGICLRGGCELVFETGEQQRCLKAHKIIIIKKIMKL